MNGPHLRLKKLLLIQNEWILVHGDGGIFSLRSHEMDLGTGSRGPYFGYLARTGYKTRRLDSIEKKRDRFVLIVSSRAGRDVERIELIPRTSASEFGAGVEVSRLEIANRIAESVATAFPRKKLRRVFLNQRSGRLVQILLDSGRATKEGLLADVSKTLTPESLLTAAVLWSCQPESRRSKGLKRVIILVENRSLPDLRKLHACLKPSAKRRVALAAIRGSDGWEEDAGDGEIYFPEPYEINDLWRSKPPKISVAEKAALSPLVKSLIRLAPGRIDHLSARNGVTLRYLGLPFARVRRLVGSEKIWFGVEREKRLLDDNSKEELFKLVRQIAEFRRYDSPNKMHLYYQARGEAWLESVLRRNIRRLDPNLYLSPLYNQFRTSRDRIDLLALRKDGRLVIVELKVSFDRGMIFQAADYWRKIEHQRRNGILDEAKIFGRRKIADKPAVVYLVAPTLCFQRESEALAESLSDDVCICRFELNEDWKRRLKVLKVRDCQGGL